MTPSTLSKVIDATFPKLYEDQREEITQKVSGHLLEKMKEESFANDPAGLQQLQTILESEPDEQKRSEAYGKRIIGKFLSLSDLEQLKIDSELEKEVVTVLHGIYKAYV